MRYLIIAALLLTGCDGIQLPEKPVKAVVTKIEPVENRVSAWDTATKKGVTTKTQTVYYLVAQDGTVCEVGFTQYFNTKLGDKVACYWEIKND